MYSSDKPILNSSEDLLYRNDFARRIAEIIMNMNTKDQLTIGLYGSWGSGKTSLINLIVEKIKIKKHNNVIVVIFNPWNYSNEVELFGQFFATLSNGIRTTKDKNLMKISTELEKYSNSFEIVKEFPQVGGVIYFLVKNLIKIVTKTLSKGNNDKDVQKQKDNIINLLNKQDKRILVIIDDINRISNRQIRQIFQLITSTANFPNITYLLSFDKEVVVNALEKIQEGSGEEYLKKIIQLPLQIPKLNRDQYAAILSNKLINLLKEFDNLTFEESIWDDFYAPSILQLITNIRDIKRLLNLIRFKLTLLNNEVNFVDLVLLTAIEITSPSIFNWIKNNKTILTGENDLSSFMNEKSQSDFYRNYFSEIENVIGRKETDPAEKEIISETIKILALLFPYFGEKIGKVIISKDMKSLRKNNNIGHPDKFDRYFELNLELIKLRKSDVDNAIYNLNHNDLNLYLQKIKKDNLSYTFLCEISASLPNLNNERTKVIATSLIQNNKLLNQNNYDNIFEPSINSFSNHLVIDLLNIINKNERYDFLKNQIQTSNFVSHPALAEIINLLELAYGRLAANGKERNTPKVITFEELLKIEKDFSTQTRRLIEKNSIFSFIDFRMILFLMESFDSLFTKELIKQELKKDINIVKFLKITTSTWTGSYLSYQITNEYEKYLTKERVLEAIQSTLSDNSFLNLSTEEKRLCAIFYLNSIGKINEDGHITKSEADDQVNLWVNSK